MSLKERLKQDLKEAMRNKQIIKRDSIRAINTMIKQIEVDERRQLDDNEIIKLIQKGIKQRQEAILQYQNANRDDLIQKEQSQIDIFKTYLPTQLDDSELEQEVRKIIDEVKANSLKDMGKIMSKAKLTIGSKADGKRINEMVKKILG
jgi:uncharacterized protein YqeY